MTSHVFACLFFAIASVAASTAQAAVYHMRGVVLELRPETNTAVIRHEAVAGLMPEMTMPFTTASTDFEALSVNDQVEFEFVMEAGSPSIARNFKVVGQTPPREAATGSQRKAPKLEEGSVVPQVELTDQDGETVSLRGERDRHTLLTFIFTRCPVPEFCPMISGQFAQIHKRLEADQLHDQVRLLSITIDPEYDTPEILRQYGGAYGADFDQWTFATAEPERIDFIASAFRLFRERNGARLDHALCTALLSPDGTVLKIWRGNAWKVDEVVSRIRDAATDSQPSSR